MKLTCIIIEDEPLAIDKLERFIQATETLELLKTFDDSTQGLHFIQNHPVDVVFLDIQMHRLNGIQLLESLTKKPFIVITSAYPEYAVKGYELDVFDYLLKPIERKRFLKTVKKLNDHVNEKQSGLNESKTHIWVKSEGRLEHICIREILYIEGMKEYLQLVLSNRKIVIKQSFVKLLTELPERLFIQVHKSWVIQIQKIDFIEQNRVKIGQKYIPIGNTYKDTFRKSISPK